MKVISKKVFNKYTEEIQIILIKNGFEQSNKNCIYEWSKLTRYGLLLVRLDREAPCNLLSIWQRFEDINKAYEILLLMNGGLNSGKCNIHNQSLSGLIDDFNSFLILIS